MRKLSEIKDEEAMDVLADIIEPAINLIADEEFKTAIKGDKSKSIQPNRLEAVKIALKNHKKDLVTILALLDGTPVEEFHYNLLTLPKMAIDLFNDKELIDFFHYQSETDSEQPSGSATESTKDSQSTSSDM